MPERAGVETQVCLAPGAQQEGQASECGLVKGGETEAEAVELRKRMRELEEVPFELLPWRCGAGP